MKKIPAENDKMSAELPLVYRVEYREFDFCPKNTLSRQKKHKRLNPWLNLSSKSNTVKIHEDMLSEKGQTQKFPKTWKSSIIYE